MSSTLNYQRTLWNSDFVIRKQSWYSTWPWWDVCIILNLFHTVIVEKHNTGFYKLSGHILWTDIAEYLLHHLSKKSRPDSDCKLEELSHMVRGRGQRLGILKVMTQTIRIWWVTWMMACWMQTPATTSSCTEQSEKGGTYATSLSQFPQSTALTQKSHCTFLALLSNDKNYQKLLLLLCVAKVSNELLVFALTDRCPGWQPLGENSTSMGNMRINWLPPLWGLSQHLIFFFTLGLHTLD